MSVEARRYLQPMIPLGIYQLTYREPGSMFTFENNKSGGPEKAQIETVFDCIGILLQTQHVKLYALSIPYE